MMILENLNPRNVFYFFEEICRIPHGSGNTEQISNYLAEFARERNLEYYQDEIGNVIIIKEASAGYEDHEPVMLQGHMDMVAVKEPECTIDMQKEGLKLATEGDSLFAQGTSLGGDDGIALAYALALLAGEYKHPRLEMVFTIDEEVGMDGARALDVSPLRAKRLINLDSEEEGIFLSGCAGGARVNLNFSCEKKFKKGIRCEIRVNGLKGGHSGGEIHKERGNAICLLGRVLRRMNEKADMCIRDIQGGVADNAIPVSARAEVLITGYASCQGGSCEMEPVSSSGVKMQECRELLEQICEEMNRGLKEELAEKDRDVKVEFTFGEMTEGRVAGEALTKRFIDLLNTLPHGVQAMSSTMPGLVETSLNPGQLYVRQAGAGKDTEDFPGTALEIFTGISVRSSLESAKTALIEQLKSLAELAGAESEVTGDYPGWAFRTTSPLREKMTEVYRELYQKEPVVQAIHAGVECGLLIHKIPGLDCVSIGPDMKDIHTTEEVLSISSTRRVWEYLVRLLEVL